MLNTLPNFSRERPLHYPVKDCFHLVIDYPTLEKDYHFQQEVDILDRIGCNMGVLIASFLVTPPADRLDDNLMEYTIAEEISSYAQSLADSIETVWDENIHDFKPIDPDDQYPYVNATEAIFGGYHSPLNSWGIARRLIPLFRFYYGHIVLPEGMNVHYDWDYDLQIFGDMAIIQFTSKVNKDILKNLLTF